jgi:hypothetical protein
MGNKILFRILPVSSFIKVTDEIDDRAIARAVIRWLPTAAARVCARSGHVGFVVDKVALG